MRFLLPATGIIVLIATGYAIQFHLSSNHAAEVETKLGVSVYDLHANKRDMKTLPEQGAPLP
jgi:hypothetical protein